MQVHVVEVLINFQSFKFLNLPFRQQDSKWGQDLTK